MSPRYLTWLSDLTDILEILRFNLWAIRLCGEWNTTKLVFSMFRDNLLANNHWLTLSSSTFRLVSKFRMLVLSRNRFVSSAKRWKSKMLEHLGRGWHTQKSKRGRKRAICLVTRNERLIFPTYWLWNFFCNILEGYFCSCVEILTMCTQRMFPRVIQSMTIDINQYLSITNMDNRWPRFVWLSIGIYFQ